MTSYIGPAPYGSPIPATQAVAATDELKWVRQGYCALVLAASVVQVLAFSGTEDNLLSTLIAMASSLVGIAYSLNTRRFQFQPISALILLFYTTTSTSGALLVKSVEWSPLADRLLVPLTTFSVLAATQVVLLLADLIYVRTRALQTARTFISKRVLQRIGVLDWPPDWHLWVLGGLGCISVLLTGTDYESGASFGIASAGDKVIRAFGFFKFAPFLIPFRNALSGVPSVQRTPIVPLVAYFVGLVIISFATNSRSTFADAIPTIGICMLIGASYGLFSLRHVPKSKLILYAIGALIATMLLSRVALAMVVVRDYRYSVDVGMLVKMTLEALMNDEWLQAAKAKMETAVNVGNYSETYVDSRFAARFLLTKFHDNILYYFTLFGPDHIEIYKQFMADRLGATLPDPLLRLFGISINKEDLVVSNGDYIVYIIDGWGLGGFKTGSMIAEVYAVFGWLFPLVIIVNALLLFVFHDAFAATAPSGRKMISPLMILLIWSLVGTTAAFGLGAETVTAIPAGIARGLPQNVLMYLIATSLVRGFGRFIGKAEPLR